MQQTTTEILSVFEKKMRLNGLAKKTIRSYKQALKDYCLFSEDFVLGNVAEYLNQKKIKVDNLKISRSHYNQVQYSFDKFWQIFYNKRLSILNKLDVPQITPEVLNEEQIIKALDSYTRRQHKIIFGLAYFSMLRHAEIWTLDLYADIDVDNLRVYVRHGKGWKPRVTILSTYIRNLILEERIERKSENNPNPWVCAKQGSKDRYLCYSEIGHIIKDAGNAIGRKDLHPHLLRHTGATHYDEQGVSTRKIQKLEGHQKIGTTQGYIHPTQDKVLEVKNKLDVLLLQSKKNGDNN